jgi:AraC-like DNA-binding protein
MPHAFLADQELDLLLTPSAWRLAGPGARAGLAPSAAEAAWRRRHRHAHPHAEVMVSLAGGGGFAVGEAVLDAAPGLVAILPGGTPHDCGLAPGSAARQLWLAWMGGRILVSLVDGGEAWSTRSVLALSAAACGADPFAGGADAANLRRLRCALASVLVQVAEAGWRTAPAASRLRAESMSAICRHLEATGGAGHSLASLARLAGVSRAYFARSFRAATGRTVGGFIDRCRSRQAEDLRRAGRSETAIAQALGFSSPQAWARWRRLRQA